MSKTLDLTQLHYYLGEAYGYKAWIIALDDSEVEEIAQEAIGDDQHSENFNPKEITTLEFLTELRVAAAGAFFAQELIVRWLNPALTLLQNKSIETFGNHNGFVALSDVFES